MTRENSGLSGFRPRAFSPIWLSFTSSSSDMSWRTAPGYVWLIENAGSWRDAHMEDFDTFLEILNEAAFEWTHADIPFWALLPFPGDKLTALED